MRPQRRRDEQRVRIDRRDERRRGAGQAQVERRGLPAVLGLDQRDMLGRDRPDVARRHGCRRSSRRRSPAPRRRPRSPARGWPRSSARCRPPRCRPRSAPSRPARRAGTEAGASDGRGARSPEAGRSDSRGRSPRPRRSRSRPAAITSAARSPIHARSMTTERLAQAESEGDRESDPRAPWEVQATPAGRQSGCTIGGCGHSHRRASSWSIMVSTLSVGCDRRCGASGRSPNRRSPVRGGAGHPHRVARPRQERAAVEPAVGVDLA